MGNGVNAKVDDGFKKLINRSYTPHFEKYVSKQSVSAEIFHTSTGASSAARIGATVEATVSRKAVLSGAFGLVKRGAALGTRLSGWGTAAYFAYEA
ncbi:TPA: IgG-binding virulence factor TspB family protein, partial [Neisseria subflava]